jgi:hypothetical protein
MLSAQLVVRLSEGQFARVEGRIAARRTRAPGCGRSCARLRRCADALQCAIAASECAQRRFVRCQCPGRCASDRVRRPPAGIRADSDSEFRGEHDSEDEDRGGLQGAAAPQGRQDGTMMLTPRSEGSSVRDRIQQDSDSDRQTKFPDPASDKHRHHLDSDSS